MNINLTLIGQLVSFVVFVWFTMKFVWTPIMSALEQRRKEIADGLAAAERGQHEQVLAEKRAVEQLHNAKQQAAEIINNAHKRANEIIEEAKTDAKAEGDRILTAAHAEVEQEVNRAKEALREKVAILVISGAEKVLQKEINADIHKDVVQSVAGQI
jgi:F-type H+-transporting ATPase subunit b